MRSALRAPGMRARCPLGPGAPPSRGLPPRPGAPLSHRLSAAACPACRLGEVAAGRIFRSPSGDPAGCPGGSSRVQVAPVLRPDWRLFQEIARRPGHLPTREHGLQRTPANTHGKGWVSSGWKDWENFTVMNTLEQGSGGPRPIVMITTFTLFHYDTRAGPVKASELQRFGSSISCMMRSVSTSILMIFW